MMSKYVRRPDVLKDISACQFLRMYDTHSKKKTGDDQGDQDEPENDENENEAPVENIYINKDEAPLENIYINLNKTPPDDEDYDEEYQFNFVMTHLEEGTNGTPLPDIIELK